MSTQQSITKLGFMIVWCAVLAGFCQTLDAAPPLLIKDSRAVGGISSPPGGIPEPPDVLPDRDKAAQYASDHFLVKLRQDTFRDTYLQGESLGLNGIDTMNQQHGITRVQRLIPDGRNINIKEKHGLSRIFVFHVPSGRNVRQIAEKYRKSPDVEYAEPDYIVHALEIPNDLDFSYQWSLNNTGQTGGKIDADIDAPEAWDTATGNSSIKIAIVDTGVDLDHPDLAGKLVAGYDFVNNDSNPQDDNGHGTHVAGIASAVTNNGIGVAGVCRGCSIMPVKVLDNYGSGEDSWVASGIIWAADQGANVINLSLGGYYDSSVLSDAVSYAYALGVVVVAARGNSGGPTPSYPAVYPQVISVGATDHNDNRSWFSSYGLDLEVTAPGENILSSYWDNIYATASGTSMATPHVSGLAGLVLSVNPALTPDEVRSILKHTADDQVGSTSEDISGFDQYFGWGRINAYNAIQSVFSPPQDPPYLYAHPENLTINAVQGGNISCGPSVTIENVGGGTLNWTASTDITSFTISPFSGTTPEILDISLDTASLPSGTTTGNLTITSQEATNSPRSVPVTVNVLSTGGMTKRVSVDSNGGQGNDWSYETSISADGRYVAFTSHASNLIPGDTDNGYWDWDIFVYDRQTGVTERVSWGSRGGEDGPCKSPSISADGRYVAFISNDWTMVPGDNYGFRNVFVHDRQSGITERVSINSNWEAGNYNSDDPSISADGRYVAFFSWANNLVPGDTNGVIDIFVRDRQMGLTERVSVTSTGGQGWQDSLEPSISADGRYVAFSSTVPFVLEGNNIGDIFVHDRQTGITELVSVDSNGVPGNDWSHSPSISADGRYVAFSSSASNLVPGDTNGTGDVFVHDRQTGLTKRVSVDSSGVQGNDWSDSPSISADGRYVAFTSFGSNLVTGDSNGTLDVFVHDRQTGATELIGGNSCGIQADTGSLLPSISADGKYVAFTSYGSNLVPGDTNETWDVFVRDRWTYDFDDDGLSYYQEQLYGTDPSNPDTDGDGMPDGWEVQYGLNPLNNVDATLDADSDGYTNLQESREMTDPTNPGSAPWTQLVSVNSSGLQGNGGSYYPSISADGRYVAFRSGANNLVTGDTNGVDDIFVHDSQTGITQRVSVDSSGVEGTGWSYSPSISADGRYVAFYSDASNLVEGDNNNYCDLNWDGVYNENCPDVFVHDRQTGVTEGMSVDSSGVQGNGDSYSPSISADGRYVAFISSASNLVPGDTNNVDDIFVHDRQTGVTERVNIGGNYNESLSISADGRYVAFCQWGNLVYDQQTGVTELVSVDSNGVRGNNWSCGPSISGDGRHVAFYSYASNLVTGDTNGFSDIFVHDRQTGVTERVSVDNNGGQGNGNSHYSPSISADGRYVAFYSDASNLVTGDTNGRGDIFIHDRQTGVTKRLSVDKSGGEGNGDSWGPSISADGRYVAFYSYASNLVFRDTNRSLDVLVRDRSLVLTNPDLIMSAISTTSTSVAPGGNFALSNAAKNHGSSPAGSFSISFRLSTNTTSGDLDDIAFTTTRSVTSLGVGETSTASTTLTIPSTTPLGTYYICAMADNGGTVTEGDETDNTLCTTSTIQVTGSLPDLVMTTLSTTTATIKPGGSIALSNTVKNQGGSSAGSFTIAFHLSTDAVYGGTNDIAFSTTRSVSSLGVGASSSASTSVTVPSTTPVGNYYICSKADSGGTVSESIETNNTRCTTSTIKVTRPDLIMTAVTPGTSTINAGATLSVTNTAKNQGGLSAGSFTIAFRLSKNTTYGDSDDVSISATRSVSSLGVGASSTATTSLTIPSTTKAGSYYVCAKADSGSTVTESNENNNTLCSSTQVTVPKPDLIMTALSTTTTAIKPGSSLSLSNTVKNQGGSSAGSFAIAFHLSIDAVYGGTDDIAFSTTRSVSSLGVGASSNASTSVTVPSTTPLSTYYICSKADNGGTVSESNETNNTRCTTSTINVTKPDLVMTAVTPGATTVNAGAALSVTNTAKNQGGISAGSFTIAFRLSKNTTYGDSDDVTISTTRSVSSLAAGASSTATTSLTIPSTTKAGNYYVCAKADSGSTVAESNENNNTRCSTSQVTVPSPDLIMSALSTAATSVARGGSFSLSNTAKNQGGSSAGSFAIAFHLSSDAVYGGTDDRAFSTTRSVSSLGVGSSSSASTSLTVPSTTPVGSYYVCAKTDSGNTVNEGTNEGNNTRCTSAVINVQ